jgi:predicted permease
MGMTYYGTGKFLLSVLLAFLGFCIGSVFSAIFGERLKKKRAKDDLRELLVKSYVEFKMKEMEKEKEKEI